MIVKCGVMNIEFMKIDVEGMEEGVFIDMFERLFCISWFWLICVEMLYLLGIVVLFSE